MIERAQRRRRRRSTPSDSRIREVGRPRTGDAQRPRAGRAPTGRRWGNRGAARPGRAGGWCADGRSSKRSNGLSWRLCRAYVPSNIERDCTRPVLANLWPVRSPGLLSRRASGRMSPAAATALGPNTSKRCWNPSDQLPFTVFSRGFSVNTSWKRPCTRDHLSMLMFCADCRFTLHELGMEAGPGAAHTANRTPVRVSEAAQRRPAAVRSRAWAAICAGLG